jgi:Rieske Fe-S protein
MPRSGGCIFLQHGRPPLLLLFCRCSAHVRCCTQGDPTYLIVTQDGGIESYGLNAVCTHLGCVVPWVGVSCRGAAARAVGTGTQRRAASHAQQQPASHWLAVLASCSHAW